MKRIAFIGAGRMANTHAAELKKIGRTELAGVYDIDPVKSRKFAETWNAAKEYASREELLADKTLDGVLICHYCPDHAETMRAVMEAGIRFIFCEKPAIRRVVEGAMLRKTAAQCHAKIMIGHHRKHDGGNKKMREIIQSGILGTIRFAKVQFCNTWYSRDWNDYFASYERSGGTTLDMVTHYVDLLNWFLDAEPESVYARAVMLEKTIPADKKPVDYVSGTLVLKNGIICGIESSYQRYGIGYDSIEVYGDERTVLLRDGKLRLYKKQEVTEYDVSASMFSYEEQMRDFIDMMEDGVQRQTTLEEGIRSAVIVLGMLDSSETGKIHIFEKELL